MSFKVGGTDYTSSTITIDEAIEKVTDQRRQRQDIQIPLKAFSLGLDANGENVTGTIDGIDYVPTLHCLKQMATWMGVSHAVLKQYMNPVLNQNGSIRYKRDQTDRELLVALFKNGIRDGRVDPEKEFKFRTYTDGTLRAMLSDKYAIIDNVWYLNEIKSIMGDEPRFTHWRGDADTLYGNLLVPDTIRQESDSEYGGMLSVSNCEIGKRRLSLTPSIFRSLCTNGLIFGQEMGERLSQVHRGSVDLMKLRERMDDNINETLPLISAGIDQFLEMQKMPLTAQPTEIIAQIAQDYKLSSGQNGQAVEVVRQFGKHESGNRNLFGIVNAITRAAQEYDPAEHVRLDEIGGGMMEYDPSKWVAYNNRAKGMSEKQRNKIFGRVAA